MRSLFALLALLAIALLSVATGACGNSSKVTSSSSPVPRRNAPGGSATSVTASRPTPSGGYLKRDGDNDDDDANPSNSAENDDRTFLASYGGNANPADTRAITALVKSYYTAATAGDGATACLLLDTDLAMGLAENESQPVQSADKSCARSLSQIFKRQHQQLAADDVATMIVTAVRVKGDIGLAVLGFRTAPEGEIILERESRAWKIDAPLGSDMT